MALLVVLSTMSNLYACDTCGCGSSGGSLGYSTELNNNFVGVRYIRQEYRSRDGIFSNSPWVQENFNTVQLWANIPITERIKLTALVPFHAHSREFTDGAEQQISGLGDASLVGFYNLIASIDYGTVKIPREYYWQVGGGIKFPTGEYDAANNTGSVNPSFQVGSGSWDYILASTFGFTKNNWGASVLVNYTFKTVNPEDYQFGNQLNYGINAFRIFKFSEKLKMTPIVGVAGEYFAKNTEFGLKVIDTEGEVFLGKLSLETTYDRYSLGVLGMLPIRQNLNAGQVELENRMAIYLNINF